MPMLKFQNDYTTLIVIFEDFIFLVYEMSDFEIIILSICVK